MNPMDMHTSKRCVDESLFAIHVQAGHSVKTHYFPCTNPTELISGFDSFILDHISMYEKLGILYMTETTFGKHIYFTSQVMMKIFYTNQDQDIQDAISDMLLVYTNQKPKPKPRIIDFYGDVVEISSNLQEFLICIIQTTSMPVYEESWFTMDHSDILLSRVDITKLIRDYIAINNLYQKINKKRSKTHIEPNNALRKILYLKNNDNVTNANLQSYISRIISRCEYV
jgi:hypothetical protein